MLETVNNILFTKMEVGRRKYRLLEFMLYGAAYLQIWISPFTKVEESFNLQACHDILYHGPNLDEYDHHQFPGVVPRTFLGPLVISLVSSPLLYLSQSKFFTQYIVRCVLSTFVIRGMTSYVRVLSVRFGSTVAVWVILLTVSQFHFVFYSSRPLANIFALVLVLHAFSAYTSSQYGRFTAFSAAAILVFRAELAGLLGLMLVYEIFSKQMYLWKNITSIKEIFISGVISLVVFIPLTVVVDSYFWRRTLWPELEVLHFNVVLNKSSEWGVMPFLWYFYSALPRSMLTAILFVPLAPVLDRRSVEYLFPAFAFIFLYSFLPHKELRFIIYTVPLLNTGAALAINYLWNRRLKSISWSLVSYGILGAVLINFLLTSVFTVVSSVNYPGGEALLRLHSLESAESNVSVHMDVAACQTGISRFLELNKNWKYDKSEDLSKEDLLRGFTHLLMSDDSYTSKEMLSIKDNFEVIDEAKGANILKEYWPFRFPRFSSSRIFTLRRRDFPHL